MNPMREYSQSESSEWILTFESSERILTIWIQWGNTHNLNLMREYSQFESGEGIPTFESDEWIFWIRWRNTHNLNPVREYSQSEIWSLKLNLKFNIILVYFRGWFCDKLKV
jgi:hypothetical protein